MRLIFILVLFLEPISLFSQRVVRREMDYIHYESNGEIGKDKKVFKKKTIPISMLIRTFIDDSIFIDSFFIGSSLYAKGLQQSDTFKCINQVWSYKHNDSFIHFFSIDSFKLKRKTHWIQKQKLNNRDYLVELTPKVIKKQDGIIVYVFKMDSYHIKDAEFHFSPEIGPVGFLYSEYPGYKILINRKYIRKFRHRKAGKYIYR